jgi:hypothetical protein
MHKAPLMLSALALAGAVSGASQAQAAEPSLFETYKALCVDTRGDPHKVEAALGPEWTQAAGLVMGLPEQPKLRRTRKVGADAWTLVVVEKTYPAAPGGSPFPVRMRGCGIETSVHGTGAVAGLRSHLGGLPVEEKDGVLSSSYFEAAAGPRPAPQAPLADLAAGLADAPFVIQAARETATGDFIVFTELRRADR